MKFEDADGLGGPRTTGDALLSGWTIFVDYDDDGVLDEGEPYDMTDEDGEYTITGIDPGTWKVKEVSQAGWTNSYPALGYYEETFKSGDSLTGNDFGNWTTATKSGVKFHDLNANGIWDTEEPGLENWKIYVDYDGDGIWDEGEPYDMTDENGEYTIIGIEPGTYDVREVMQEGWTQSLPGLDDDYAYNVTFTSGMVDEDNDFGNYIACHDETAWGYNGCYDKDFLDTGIFSNPEFSNWGWTNGPIDVTSDGALELELLAAAGSAGKNPDKYSDWENGIDVGTVFIEWEDGHVTVTYEVDSPYSLKDVHLWVGDDLLPMTDSGNYTNAPGQFPYGGFIEDNSCTIVIDGVFEGDIYVAAHAVVCIPGMED